MKKLMLFAFLLTSLVSFGEITIIDGVKYECVDGMCMPVEEEGEDFGQGVEAGVGAEEGVGEVCLPSRIAQGYMKGEDFIAFLKNEQSDGEALPATTLASLLVTLLTILLGGFLMNLTPCVLPMIPINLMIIGKSAARGAWYGLGIAVAYGVLGVLASVGGMAFGTIQGNPWFNLGVAALFIILALALADVFFIDLSKKRAGLAQKRASMLPWLFAFFMGVVSAILAGACVAPILISVLLLTAKLYAEGQTLALGLPFVLGLGMALPWPFLGAGLQILPKPGAWMKWVNRAFALLVLGAAAWYAYLAYRGFTVSEIASSEHEGEVNVLRATPETFPAMLACEDPVAKPVLVDCWATWCKNCAAMEKVMEEREVAEELKAFTVIKLQSEDMKALKALPGFEEIRGLPAFVIFE